MPSSRLLAGLSAAGGIAALVGAAASRFAVANRSMLPSVLPGDRLLVETITYRARPPRRGEIVLLRDPERSGRVILKRIIGLPGDDVRLGASLLIDGQPIAEPYVKYGARAPDQHHWAVPEGRYVVLGDNRRESRDSRHFGAVPGTDIVGRAWCRYWPPERRGRFT